MSEWKCSYGKACECSSDVEKSECDLAYKTKMMKATELRIGNWVTHPLVTSMIIGVIVGTVTFLISIAMLFPIYFIIKGSFDSSGWIFIVSACIGWFFFVASAIVTLITEL